MTRAVTLHVRLNGAHHQCFEEVVNILQDPVGRSLGAAIGRISEQQCTRKVNDCDVSDLFFLNRLAYRFHCTAWAVVEQRHPDIYPWND